jgi:hypothetical protein
MGAEYNQPKIRRHSSSTVACGSFAAVSLMCLTWMHERVSRCYPAKSKCEGSKLYYMRLALESSALFRFRIVGRLRWAPHVRMARQCYVGKTDKRR